MERVRGIPPYSGMPDGVRPCGFMPDARGASRKETHDSVPVAEGDCAARPTAAAQMA